MKVAIGEFLHESNSFSGDATDTEQFKKQSAYHENCQLFGNDIISTAKGVQCCMGAFIDKGIEYGWELVPTVLVETQPSGMIVREDVLTKMGFKPIISKDLKSISKEIFQSKCGGLKDLIQYKKN